MNILESIVGAGNGAVVRQLGSQFGLPEDKTAAALGSLVPALAAALQRNAQSPGGLTSLVGALASGGHTQYVENPATLAQPDAIATGNGILGHVFGSKDVSREVAAKAASQTGIGVDVLKKMLPTAAALTMGALARESASIGGPTAPAAPGAAGRSLLGILNATLDRNRSGSFLDEAMGVLGALHR